MEGENVENVIIDILPNVYPLNNKDDISSVLDLTNNNYIKSN